ncbi:MAG: DUF4097 domain-containing protein, partial [Anaeroplasmataceae bacterium]|nr:DUF4097 domain-containing protein [Anaeroplasmataceae bacterium]
MKIKGFIVLGLVLSILGAGITACATLRKDFKWENVWKDPELEEKELELKNVKSIEYHGSADYLVIHEAESSSIKYSEGKYLTYDISYDEETGSIKIEQKFSNHPFWDITGGSGIYINLSKDMSFDLDLSLSTGKITLKDLDVSKLSCHINCGDLEMSNVNVKDGSIKVNTGDIRYSGLVEASLKAKVNCGYV